MALGTSKGCLMENHQLKKPHATVPMPEDFPPPGGGGNLADECCTQGRFWHISDDRQYLKYSIIQSKIFSYITYIHTVHVYRIYVEIVHVYGIYVQYMYAV